MPYFTAKDATSLYYEETGSGVPLLFVHGWSFSSGVWSLQKSCFSSRYRCIALDLRGHGRSMPSRSGYGIDVLSSDVAELFDILCLTNATLFGWSLGALVALAAYPAVKERVAAMVLVSGTAKYCADADYPVGGAAEGTKITFAAAEEKPRQGDRWFSASNVYRGRGGGKRV